MTYKLSAQNFCYTFLYIGLRRRAYTVRAYFFMRKIFQGISIHYDQINVYSKSCTFVYVRLPQTNMDSTKIKRRRRFLVSSGQRLLQMQHYPMIQIISSNKESVIFLAFSLIKTLKKGTVSCFKQLWRYVGYGAIFNLSWCELMKRKLQSFSLSVGFRDKRRTTNSAALRNVLPFGKVLSASALFFCILKIYSRLCAAWTAQPRRLFTCPFSLPNSVLPNSDNSFSATMLSWRRCHVGPRIKLSFETMHCVGVRSIFSAWDDLPGSLVCRGRHLNASVFLIFRVSFGKTKIMGCEKEDEGDKLLSLWCSTDACGQVESPLGSICDVFEEKMTDIYIAELRWSKESFPSPLFQSPRRTGTRGARLRYKFCLKLK